MKTFLISYDNGQSYDDHDVSPVLAATEEKTAVDAVTLLNQWLELKREQNPLISTELPDDEWAKKHAARQGKLKRLRYPFELKETLLDDLNYNHGGFFRYQEIKTI